MFRPAFDFPVTVGRPHGEKEKTKRIVGSIRTSGV